MAGNKKIVIEIFSDGSSKVDAIGFVGNSCSMATKEIEYALAGNDPGNRDDKKKPEYAMHSGSNTLSNNN